jgi:hypothetical protein
MADKAHTRILTISIPDRSFADPIAGIILMEAALTKLNGRAE